MMESSDWISLGAVVIALLALAISIYEISNNKPRLRLLSGHLFTQGELGRLVYLTVINYGRQPTTLTAVEVSIPGSKRRLYLPPTTLGDSCPHFLEIGKSARFVYRLSGHTRGESIIGGPDVELAPILSNPRTQFLLDDVWHKRPHKVDFPRIVPD